MGTHKKTNAIIDNGDTLDIHLGSYLEFSVNNGTPAKNQSLPYGFGEGRSSVSLLGLLHVCWQRAWLHVWHPVRQYPRTINTAQRSIGAIAGQITIRNHPLLDRLAMPNWRKDQDRTQNMARNQQDLYKKTAKPGQAAIVIGVAKRWVASKSAEGGVGIGLDLLEKLLWIPPEKALVMAQSFGQLAKETGREDCHIFTIARRADRCEMQKSPLGR